MVYIYAIIGVALCLLLVTSKGLPTRYETCLSTPKGSMVALMDCPPRPPAGG